MESPEKPAAERFGLGVLRVGRVRFFERATDAGPDGDSQLGRSGEQLTKAFGGAVAEGADHGGHPSFAQYGECNPTDTIRGVVWPTLGEFIGNTVRRVPTPLRTERVALVVEALPAGSVAGSASAGLAGFVEVIHSPVVTFSPPMMSGYSRPNSARTFASASFIAFWFSGFE